MIASHSKPSRLVSPGRHRGFSMTELLVVIAIIAVLAGILLVAMRGVRETGLRTQTESTMQEFSKACDMFQIEHGRYPGVIPEHVLADPSFDPAPPISGTENAMLHLMGGYRVVHPQLAPDNTGDYAAFGGQEITFGPTEWKLKVDINLMGEGPVVNGRPFAPYFTPGAAALGVAKGQVGPGALQSGRLPDLLDAWGQPIIYVRSMRSTGLLVGDASANPQFNRATMTPYTESTVLGAFGKDQMELSIFNTAPDADATFAQIIRHPGFGEPGEPLNGTARGAYVLISAGPDGIFFSRQDGPGSPGNPIGGADLPFNEFMSLGARVIDEFDDVRMFGGG